MASPTASSQRRRPGTTRRSSRSKREDILTAATEVFARQGYEHSKWADIAEAVGVGSTALYHYFESKLHCLYEIQAQAVHADREKFDRVIAEHDDFVEGLTAVLDSAFELTELEALRNRVLVASSRWSACIARRHGRRRRVSAPARTCATSSSPGPRS